MTPIDLKVRILLAIGAGTTVLACGDTDSDSSDKPTADAAYDGATLDAPVDTASDAPVACVVAGASCTQTDVCCPPATCVGGTCLPSARRPFLVGSSLRVAQAAERHDWLVNDVEARAHDLDPVTAHALARDWLQDACEEHASVAAFARFTLHLVSVGAPPAMIVKSQRAAVDEVRHARACFELARRYGGRAMGPAALSLDGAVRPMTLAEIAALVAEEGCVGETLGALLAREQLRGTTDPVVRSRLMKANIVDDEARHAELAWSFVRWAIDRGGDPVRRAVALAIRRAVGDTLAMPIRKYDGVDLDGWRAHGRLTCEEAHAVAERGVRELVEPCTELVLTPLESTTEMPPNYSAPALVKYWKS